MHHHRYIIWDVLGLCTMSVLVTTRTDTVEIINFDCPEFQFLLHLCNIMLSCNSELYSYIFSTSRILNTTSKSVLMLVIKEHDSCTGSTYLCTYTATNTWNCSRIKCLYEIAFESDSGLAVIERVQSSKDCTEETCTHSFIPGSANGSSYHVTVAAKNAVS